ncbi:hypothetical protein CAPTEDRAFT_148927, partial [Capitella teleta]
MEAFAKLVKVQLPKYLKNLPIPSTVDGLAKLKGDDFVLLAPFFLAVIFIVYAIVKLLLPKPSPPPPICNPAIKKESPKVADLVEIEDLAKEKISYCRCWRSSKFPYCDGTHNKHNETTGDNVGPLVLKRKEKE